MDILYGLFTFGGNMDDVGFWFILIIVIFTLGFLVINYPLQLIAGILLLMVLSLGTRS